MTYSIEALLYWQYVYIFLDSVRTVHIITTNLGNTAISKEASKMGGKITKPILKKGSHSSRRDRDESKNDTHAAVDSSPVPEPVEIQKVEEVTEPIEVRSEESHKNNRFSPPKRIGITFNTDHHRNSQRDASSSTHMTGAQTLDGDECKLTERPFHLEKVARVPTKAYLRSGDAKKMLLSKDGNNDSDDEEYSD